MNNIGIALAFDYHEEVNYALVQSKMHICNWCIVENNTNEDLEGITLSISGEYVETYTSMPFRLEAGQRVRLQEIALQVNIQKLLALTERVVSTITVHIHCGEQSLKTQSYPITFLAYNQWHGIESYPQLLTSFITPNHPYIAAVVKRAASHLQRLSGSSAFCGYFEDTKNHVYHEVEAVYEALLDEHISYSLIQPNYESCGQRIRFASQVLDEKIGNCMDLTLLFAACLEYIGLHPILVVLAEHVFLGVWLTPESHIRSVDDDISFLLKRCAVGVEDILPIESTAFAAATTVPFSEAVQQADYQLQSQAGFQLFIDVYRCRLEGFRPLPQVVKRDSLWEISNETPVPTPTNIPHTDTNDAAVNNETRKWPKKLLWERKLLDFTMRNTLLHIKMSSAIQLMSVSLDTIAKRMLELKKGLRIDEAPQDENGMADNELVFDSTQIGIDNINIVTDDIRNGRLHSYYNDTETTRILKNLRRNARTMLEENGANSLFMTFGLLQWQDDSGLSHLAPILLLPVELVYKNQIYHVKWREEETLLNVTLFEYLKQTYEIEFDGLGDALQNESTFNLQEIFSIIRQGLFKKPGWNVQEECLIGIFSFSKFILWNDIHVRGDEMGKHPLVRAMLEGETLTTSQANNATTPETLDTSTKPADLCVPLPFDSSQLCAVIEATQGKSFILHGPPGTGKSQTITNMIANALYHGKRVLFVAEKMAALSVVQNRLEKLGVGDFCLELHSNKATKRHLLQQLNVLMEQMEQGEATGKLLPMAEQLYNERQVLVAHTEALHARTMPNKFSLYESITHYIRFGQNGRLDFIDAYRPDITPQNLTEYEYYIDRLTAVIRLVGQPFRHPLLGLHTLPQTTAHINELPNIMRECLQHTTTLHKIVATVAQWANVVPPVALKGIVNMMNEVAKIYTLRTQIGTTASKTIFTCNAQTLEVKMAKIRQASILGRLCRKWFLWQHLKTFVKKLSWNNIEPLANQLIELNKLPLHAQISIDTPLDQVVKSYEAWHNCLTQLETKIEIDNVALLSIAELEERLDRWAAHTDKLKEWKQWCLMKDDLLQKHLNDIVYRLESSDIELSTLKNGYLAQYFYELANQQIAEHPETDLFNGMLFDEKIRHYKELAEQFRHLSIEELQNRLREQARRTHTNEQFKSQSLLLHKAIANNGRGLSIRRIFEMVPDLLVGFCPCMLMSPMSVAQFLQMKRNMFDLVIFDEASQIPTHEAVGAIARGKAVVIVGDAKQMPPTTFFSTNKTVEEEFDVDDLDNILEDCQALNMPALLLAWHYRSRHESLISFSNNEYYDNRLHTFPTIDDRERRVVYVPVKGIYQKGGRRSNRNEALAIVNEIERRLNDPHLRKLSMGVISFNVQQQYLIEDLLEARLETNKQLRTWAEESGEPIFIKNLENVQGDERDVILFSVGYGPDKNGQISMNFGPLNLTGGERRLNVAVTRSRHEMMVFSSLHAHDIDLRRSQAKGVEGLHRFLDYAENGTLVENVHFDNKQAVEKFITQQIAKRLEDKGLKVNTFVGKSQFKINIAIIDPNDCNRYLLGILLDDEIYYSIPTMSDREIVHPTMLTSLDWKIKRIWTLDWFERPEHVIDTILTELKNTQL
ncbi:MAG: DUF4011 domain-containing protein [Paludibacteraceae bacterium]